MRYDYHLRKDYHKIPAEDKQAVFAMLRDGPKTTKQMAEASDMDSIHVRNVVQVLEGIGAVQYAGRGPKGAKLWEVKA